MARQGKAREGKARQGKARQDKARQGKARQGKAREVQARQNKARQGQLAKAMYGNTGQDGGNTWLGYLGTSGRNKAKRNVGNHAASYPSSSQLFNLSAIV